MLDKVLEKIKNIIGIETFDKDIALKKILLLIASVTKYRDKCYQEIFL